MLSALSLLLAGCGRRGPLRLPAETAAPANRNDDSEEKGGM